jgi:histidine triad (HIT) family protein
MPYDSNNIFAKILRGELPCVKVYEDTLTLAFLDIMPSTPGHTLVIPREPAQTIFDLSPEGAAALTAATRKVAAAVQRALGCEGIMLAQLNGAAAGQSVPHVHFHILPRDHGLELNFHGREMVDATVLEPVAAKIRSAL